MRTALLSRGWHCAQRRTGLQGASLPGSKISFLSTRIVSMDDPCSSSARPGANVCDRREQVYPPSASGRAFAPRRSSSAADDNCPGRLPPPTAFANPKMPSFSAPEAIYPIRCLFPLWTLYHTAGYAIISHRLIIAENPLWCNTPP